VVGPCPQKNLEALTQYGLAGLFLASFAAATILPLGSEVVLGVLLANGHDPTLSVIVATIGNVLGSVVNYLMGVWGAKFTMERILRISEKEFTRATRRFKRFGAPCLLFAWVPVIGDPLTLAAGVLRVNFPLFLILVTIGKGLRYIAVAAAFTAW